MAVPPTPTLVQEFAGDLELRPTTGHRFPAQSLDLTTVNAVVSTIYDISGLNRASVRVQATWAGAVAEVEGSIDGVNWTNLQTLDSVTPQIVNLSVQGYTFLRVETTTANAGASSAAGITLYAFLIHA